MSRKTVRGSKLTSSVTGNPLSQKSPDHRQPDMKTKLTNLQNVLDDFSNLAIEHKTGSNKSKDWKPRRIHTTPKKTKHNVKPEPAEECEDDTSKSNKVDAAKESDEKNIKKGQGNGRRSQRIEKKVMDWRIENYENMVEVKKEPFAEFPCSVAINKGADSSFEDDNNIDGKTVSTTNNMWIQSHTNKTPIKSPAEEIGGNAGKKKVSRKSVPPKRQPANDKNSNTNLVPVSSDSTRKNQVKRSASGAAAITKPVADNLDPSKTKVKSKSGGKPTPKISHPPKIDANRAIDTKKLGKFEKELRQREEKRKDRKVMRRERRVARAMETLSHEVVNIVKEMGYLSQSSSDSDSDSDRNSDSFSSSSSSCSCSSSSSCSCSFSCSCSYSCSCSSSSCSCGSYTSESSSSDRYSEYTLCSCSNCGSSRRTDKSDSESDSMGTESS